MAHIVAIGPSMISAGPPTGHPRAEKLEPPLGWHVYGEKVVISQRRYKI